MNPSAEPGFAADTPRGALLRAAIAGIALAALLLVALRPAGENGMEQAASPRSESFSPVVPLIAPDAPSGDLALTPPEMVPSAGAPSGEAPFESGRAAQLVAPDEAPAPEPESETLADAATQPADAADVSPRAALPAPESDRTRDAPRPDPATSEAPPVLTELKPRPPALMIAEERVRTVIPDGAEPLPEQLPPPPPVPAEDRHAVLLGEFLPIDEARALQSSAGEAGYPSRMLHRVLLGPFGSQANAKAAQRGTRGILIGGGDAWWVQLGVFAEAANAEGLRAKMAKEGREAVLQGRIELGPYAGRISAEQVLGAVREALGQPLPEARVVAR